MSDDPRDRRHPEAADPVPAGPLPDPDHDPTARALRDALAARAAAVPADERQVTRTLEEIRMKTRTRTRHTRAWAAAGVAAAVVVVGGGVAVATARTGGTVRTASVAAAPTADPATTGATATATRTSTATSSRSAAATAPGAATSASGTGTAGGTGAAAAGTPTALPSTGARVPVYWVTDSGRLARQYASVAGGGSDATRALRTMLAGPAPDPDYSTPWRADGTATVAVSGGRLQVTLSAATGAAKVSGTQADLALQQLVYTVTAAAQQSLPVHVQVSDGDQVLFGRALPEVVQRTAQAQVLAPATIEATDTTTAGRVTVSGVGTAFEGTLLYTVTDAAGAEVARDSVQAGANGTYAAFRFTVALPAGTYTVTVSAPDESGGEASPVAGDTKQVTVR